MLVLVIDLLKYSISNKSNFVSATAYFQQIFFSSLLSPHETHEQSLNIDKKKSSPSMFKLFLLMNNKALVADVIIMKFKKKSLFQ